MTDEEIRERDTARWLRAIYWEGNPPPEDEVMTAWYWIARAVLAALAEQREQHERERSKFLEDLNELLDGFTYGEEVEFSVGTPTLAKVRQIREAWGALRERADAADNANAVLRGTERILRGTLDEQQSRYAERIAELEADGRRLNWLLDQEIGYHGRSDIDAATADEEERDDIAELRREKVKTGNWEESNGD